MPSQRIGIMGGLVEIQPQYGTLPPQIAAFRVATGHAPTRLPRRQQVSSIKLYCVAVILIHMPNGIRLPGGHRLRISLLVEQFTPVDPFDLAKPGNQMAALDRNLKKGEITKIGIAGGIFMARQIALAQTHIVNPRHPPRPALNADPRTGQGGGQATGAVKQQ